MVMVHYKGLPIEPGVVNGFFEPNEALANQLIELLDPQVEIGEEFGVLGAVLLNRGPVWKHTDDAYLGHLTWGFVLASEGHRLVIGSQSWPLEAGSFYQLDPNVEHSTTCTTREGALLIAFCDRPDGNYSIQDVQKEMLRSMEAAKQLVERKKADDRRSHEEEQFRYRGIGAVDSPANPA